MRTYHGPPPGDLPQIAPPTYLLIPGNVRSRNDGDRHRIDGRQLIDCYGLQRDRCLIYARPEHMQIAIAHRYIQLHPVATGNYNGVLWHAIVDWLENHPQLRDRRHQEYYYSHSRFLGIIPGAALGPERALRVSREAMRSRLMTWGDAIRELGRCPDTHADPNPTRRGEMRRQLAEQHRAEQERRILEASNARMLQAGRNGLTENYRDPVAEQRERVIAENSLENPLNHNHHEKAETEDDSFATGPRRLRIRRGE